jgi:chaperone modulatory protein CbpM
MIRLEMVVTTVRGIAVSDVADWIARGWIAPGGTPPDWVFTESDVARVRLVRELRDEAGIPEDTLPVVLSLVDQVHDLRHALRAVTDAVTALPPPLRDEVLARLRR